MASGEQFFDATDMNRGSAFAFSGGAHDVDSPDAEAAGEQGSRVHPWPVALSPAQKVGLSKGDFHPELQDAARTGRMGLDDDPNGSNLCAGPAGGAYGG